MQALKPAAAAVLPQRDVPFRPAFRVSIFLTAPLASFCCCTPIIYVPALMIALFVIPHMVHASLINSKIQGKYRHSSGGNLAKRYWHGISHRRLWSR
ncbi:hypothetical protein KCP73_13690 [Salmonella enterica subsp. enterica]|nr:hypothetical protein KCP73_13690 [Salmonella enterica subsp. enterica]